MGTSMLTSQGITKDCVVGDRNMNRYGIFNGLEYPRRIGPTLEVTRLGFLTTAITSVTSVGSGGSLESGKWYSYKAVYASKKYTRPVASADGTGAYTRGNGGAYSSAVGTAPNDSMTVVVPASTDAGVTTIFLYRSLGASTQAEAEAGPFYYVAQGVNTGASVTIVDGTADLSVGLAIETDNYAPNAYRYATCVDSYIFAGGNFSIGSGITCTVTNGSPLVTLSSNVAYDGITGWYFRCLNDTTGGADGAGLYYANYVNATTITLVDASGVSANYTGTSGSGKTFTLFLPGYVLRWCKQGEPEAWPLTNILNFEGNLSGITQIPNLPLLLVCTDTPSMYVLDCTLIGTDSFKTNKRLISTQYSATSHYGLVSADARVRGIDAHAGCIFETDGVSVENITEKTVPRIWEFLEEDEDKIKNWHSTYDPRQHLYAAFVTLRGGHRICDFSINQHICTQSWYFNMEKDLLCTTQYTDPASGITMILGGTQGLPGGSGAVWGRIWTPDVYSEWIPSGTLTSGTITGATSTVLTVDNTTPALDLYTAGGGLMGRWVLVCDANGESAQVAYIRSNTANTITLDTVLNSIDPLNFNPVPVAGWLFYTGLCELRWGPKRLDFGDPDNDKKIFEILATMTDVDTTKLPILRIYRGLESGYVATNQFTKANYRDGTTPNDTYYSRYSNMGEDMPRWAFAIIDRSYNKVELRSASVVFSRVGGKNEHKRQD